MAVITILRRVLQFKKEYYNCESVLQFNSKKEYGGEKCMIITGCRIINPTAINIHNKLLFTLSIQKEYYNSVLQFKKAVLQGDENEVCNFSIYY